MRRWRLSVTCNLGQEKKVKYDISAILSPSFLKVEAGSLTKSLM